MKNNNILYAMPPLSSLLSSIHGKLSCHGTSRMCETFEEENLLELLCLIYTFCNVVS